MPERNLTTVLVVDDTEANRFFISRVLEGAGCRVLEAASGAEGIRIAREARPHAIVLDVRLGDTTGFEVVRQLREDEATTSIPVCLISASFKTDDSRVFGLESGADAYLTHPVVPAVLLATLHSLLRVRRAEAAQRFLAQAGALLSTSLDWTTTLRNVAQSVLPGLADWAVIYTTDGLGVHATAWAHADPAREHDLAEAVQRVAARVVTDEGPIGRALRAGETAFIPARDDAAVDAMAMDDEHRALLRTLDARSTIVAPLVTRGRNLGALVLERAGIRAPFERADIAVAEELARRAALAMDNARLYLEAEAARRDAEAARLQAEAANRVKSDFLATMSHELRTPLNAIAGYVDLLEMELRGPITQAQKDDLARIRRSQQHLAGLIEGVLNFAKLEAGRLETRIVDVALIETLADVEALTAPQVRAAGLYYVSDACSRSLRVRADREGLRQILLNLISNAVKFTPTGGTVRVECGMSADTVTVRVHDTGVGVPTDKLDAIFEPFVQVDGRLTREREGVGLGLAISRDLARTMGGEITASSAVGQGSVFTLTLPRAEDDPTAETAGATAAAAPGDVHA